MDFVTLIVLAVGLSMDAFAVSVCKGLAMPKITFGKSLIAGLWFGGFQALMPFIGYALGVQFESFINAVAPWIAFVLLVLIGGNMVRESLSKEEEAVTDTLKMKEMFILAVATSIDALAVGITFACVPAAISTALSEFLNTILACILIGMTTCIISMAGIKIGNIFGTKYKNKAECGGGIILILLGLKILLEHFGIL